MPFDAQVVPRDTVSSLVAWTSPRSVSKHQPGYGFGVSAVDIEPHGWDPRELGERVRAVFASPAYRPPNLPQVALEVMSLSHQRDVDFKQIASLIERDPVLAARLLKVANSAAYRGSSPTRTMRDAVQRLGLSLLRDMVMAEAMSMRVFRAGGGYADGLEELRLHSLATAHLARLVCRETSLDTEYAFLCGLLHDIGIAAILLAMGDVARGQTPPGLDLLWPVADEAHAAVGAQVARLWNLPADVALVIERHGRVRLEGRPHPLVAAVQIAEELAMAGGLGLLPKLPDGVVMMSVDSVDADESAVARAALGIDERTMGRLLEGTEQVIATLG